CIEHASHLLPSQGPITVFVHHNTLHSFEDLPFDEAVKKGASTYRCQPYLPEDFYRGEVARRRISPDNLAAVLIEDLGEDADSLIARFGASKVERWTDRECESFTLHALWRICHNGVHGVGPFAEVSPLPRRHRDLLLMATGRDTDLLVHEVLIRFCAAFLDQG